MRWLLLSILLALSGCRTFYLPDSWAPLEKVSETPILRINNAISGNNWSTTIGNTLYVSDLDEFRRDRSVDGYKAGLLHEQVHSIRQQEYGLFSWLFRYITEPAFMKYEEQMAYYYQIKYLRQHNIDWDRREFADLLTSYSNLRGEMTTRHAAEKWFDEIDRWQPLFPMNVLDIKH